jgi:hypothetical protein
VITFGQAEAALLELVAEVLKGDEKAAVGVLKASDAKERVFTLVGQLGLSGFDLQELHDGIEAYWQDKEERNRLMHDEWYPRFTDGSVGQRGLTRKRHPEEVFHKRTPDEVWQLAKRFQDYEGLFSARAYWIRRGRDASPPK